MDNKQTKEIYGHTVSYAWFNDDKEDRQLDEADIEYIKSLISQGYREGELAQQYDFESSREVRGWWKIERG